MFFSNHLTLQHQPPHTSRWPSKVYNLMSTKLKDLCRNKSSPPEDFKHLCGVWCPYHLRGAFKIKKRRNLGKVPKSSKIQKVPKFQLGKFQKEGGVSHFQKFPSLKNKALFSISWGPLSRRIYIFFANNTLMLQIVGHLHLGTFPKFQRFLIWKCV